MAYAKLKTAALFGAAVILAGGTALVVNQLAAQPGQNPAALLQGFVAEKLAQAKAAAAAAGAEMLPEFKAVFAAAQKGDWPTISKAWTELQRRAPQFGGGDALLSGTQWETIKEVWGAYDNLEAGKVKYPVTLAHKVIESIPAGSIYFGGTDPGRFLISALQASHVKAEPFFTLTQNCMADTEYLAYLRSFYGSRMYTPTEQDSKTAFENAKTQVKGQVSVVDINSRLTRLIFDKNPDREFYVEESIPLDWMFPYLEPHGLILKLNRQPLNSLPGSTIQADHDYWTQQLTPMIGDWLNYNTTVKEVCAFAEKVHLNHDLSQFKGDREFVGNDWAQKWLSKLRSSIAGLYAWRLSGQAPIQYRVADESKRELLLKEADFAFRQGVALCPRSPEVVYRYAGFLVSQNRNADARLLAGLASRLDPQNPQLKDLLTRIPKVGN